MKSIYVYRDDDGDLVASHHSEKDYVAKFKEPNLLIKFLLDKSNINKIITIVYPNTYFTNTVRSLTLAEIVDLFN